MRISDWSSDVCSSDLAKRGLSTSHLASVRFREGSAGGGLAVSFAFWRGNPAITRGSNVYVQSIDWDSVTNPRNPAGTMRSDEGRVGKEGVGTCRCRGSADQKKKKQRRKIRESK